MNETVLKRASIFALMLGGIMGIVSVIPSLIGFILFILSFFTSVIVIVYMKKNEKYLTFIDNQQGAVLGGFVGFFSSLGFFITFCPLICIIHFLFKNYYSYGIPDILKEAFWLFLIIVFMVSIIFAFINSAMGMGIAWLYSKIETKPKNSDAPLDIEIND